ncbi:MULTISPECIES: 16S rRNA (guanine(966)-N(2))-methyltransferase RsmD [Rothia]|uniref:16S rRNA (guanine(966)-N(2))-methyltransferase RsmD n=1 Tax=Rothia TaxID=32207 RepID=UPI00066D2108|nr:MULTISPECIES: 16S rRNA (guanine(966)-N(2))-methyltransferase RsmD [Rothia]OFL73903.1 16S rRNA (guanine(966)-N(2))-methyltransferase RsmD [Rothia sp. HMSC075F09]OFQ75648.1 16S rRNA (guanine(966)-N(2))-methyltransferase RsmD [Rothia sp. HMSC068E02]
MSRIISGAAGGVRLASVPGDNTRPTTDRVKESLFSKLESYDIIRGARVLDAFGGSGALGCEALSRGAASVTLLDTYPKAVAVIRKNVAAVEKAMGRTGSGSSGATGSAARVQQSQALTYVKSASGPWDLVFVDPPYAMPNEQVSELLEALTPKLAEGAVVVVERSSRDAEPVWGEGLYCFSTRQHGETVLYYVEPDEAEEQAGDESGENTEPGEDAEELAA